MSKALLPIVGGPLAGQHTSSCPPGYRLQSFFLRSTVTLAFVENEIAFDAAREALIELTRLHARSSMD